MTSHLAFEDAAILTGDGKVAAWFGTPASILGAGASTALQMLDARERARCSALRFESDRIAYLAAHVLHRQVWGRTLEIAPHEVDIRHDSKGRPMIAGPDGKSYFTSLSRRRGMVAAAVSHGGPVGIDVEEAGARPEGKEMLARFLGPASYASICLEIESDSSAFARTWTLIEAFAKVRGTGLADSLSGVDISTVGDRLYQLADAHMHCLARSCSADRTHVVSIAWRHD